MSYKNRTLQIIIFFIAITIAMIGQGIVIPLVTKYITIEHLNPIIAGIVMSAYSLGGLVAAPFIGNYINRNKSKNILQYSIVLYLIFLYFIFIFQNYVWLVIFFRFLSGILMSAIFAAVETYISKYESEKNQSKDFLIISFANSLGMAIGPILGTFIMLGNGNYILILLIIIALIVGFMIEKIIIEENKVHQEQLNEPLINRLISFIQDIIGLKLNSKAMHALIGFLVFGFITASFETFGISYIIDKYEKIFQNSNLELLMFEAIVILIATGIYLFKVNAYIIKKYNISNLINWTAIISGIGFIVTLLNINIYLFLLIISITFISLVVFSNSIILYLSVSSSNKGLILGLKNSAMAVGAILGPIISGMIFQFNDALFLVSMILILITFGFWGLKITHKE